MRRIIQWTLVPAAVVAIAACGKSGSRTPTAMNDDLKRDLKLASTTQSLQINPDEISPKSHQDLAMKPKAAPQGKLVIRSEHPTIRASAKPTDVAQIKTDIPAVEVMASSPAPSETPTTDAAPPLARPSALPAQTYPASERIPEGGSSGSAGGILGGIFGAVIRGGGVGDDHCDPHPGPRRTGRPIGGDVTTPGGTAGMIGGIIGGMAGGRMPRGRP